jgi:hypothetical protein
MNVCVEHGKQSDVFALELKAICNGEGNNSAKGPAEQMICWIFMPCGFREDQGCALGQRPEEFPDRDVKARRGLLQDAIVANAILRARASSSP